MKRNLLFLAVPAFSLCAIIIFSSGKNNNNNNPQIIESAKVSDDQCNDSIWKHVFNTKHLHVIEKCVTISGIIESKKMEEDGDLHLRLRPDKDYMELMNDANLKFQDSCLVVEIICVGKIKDEDAFIPCTGYQNEVFIPRKGSHVKVTGTFVMDKKHGWHELHPATRIEIF